jgi:hypothetical protein
MKKLNRFNRGSIRFGGIKKEFWLNQPATWLIFDSICWTRQNNTWQTFMVLSSFFCLVQYLIDIRTESGVSLIYEWCETNYTIYALMLLPTEHTSWLHDTTIQYQDFTLALPSRRTKILIALIGKCRALRGTIDQWSETHKRYWWILSFLHSKIILMVF